MKDMKKNNTTKQATRKHKGMSDEEVQKLADIICRSGDDPANKSAALLVLMDEVQKCNHPEDVASTVKRVAFSRCADENIYGMVDAQVELFRGELPL